MSFTVTELANNHGSGSATLTVTGLTYGGTNTLVCVGIGSTTGQTISSVSDGTNSFIKAVSSSGQSTVIISDLWYCANPINVSSATITITATGTEFIYADVFKVTGFTNRPALDQTGSGVNAGSSTSTTMTTGTLTFATEIAVATTINNVNASTATASGFTSLTNIATNPYNYYTFYESLSSTSAVTFTPTFTNSSFISGAVATFYSGGGGNFNMPMAGF